MPVNTACIIAAIFTFCCITSADESRPPGLSDRSLSQVAQDADAGNVPAQVELAHRYAKGIGVAASAETANSWYLKAANSGSDVAAYNLGVAALNGFGTDKNPAKAATWFGQ